MVACHSPLSTPYDGILRMRKNVISGIDVTLSGNKTRVIVTVRRCSQNNSQFVITEIPERGRNKTKVIDDSNTTGLIEYIRFAIIRNRPFNEKSTLIAV